ncbi:MAG: hypothetical protein WDM81_04000 [Rhizomicrobium sp.]
MRPKTSRIAFSARPRSGTCSRKASTGINSWNSVRWIFAIASQQNATAGAIQSMRDAMLEQNAEKGGRRIQIRRRIGFAIPPGRMRKSVHGRQREGHAAFVRRYLHQKIASAKRQLPVEGANRIYRFERELHVDRLARRIALVGLQARAEAAIRVAIGGQRVGDRRRRLAVEFRRKAPPLQQPRIAQG